MLALTPRQRVLSIRDGDVSARTAMDRVTVAVRGVHPVPPSAGGEVVALRRQAGFQVAAGHVAEAVSAGPARQPVGPGAAGQRVGARAAGQDVVAGRALERVAAREARDPVVARTAVDAVRAGTTADAVVSLQPGGARIGAAGAGGQHAAPATATVSIVSANKIRISSHVRRVPERSCRVVDG